MTVDHMAKDELVGWARRPGADRAPAPGTQGPSALSSRRGRPRAPHAERDSQGRRAGDLNLLPN